MGDIFITWDENHNGFVNFVYNNIITRNNATQTILHAFVNPSLKEHDKPSFAPWIYEHGCLTSARGASEASLIAFIVNNYMKGGANIREHDSNGDVSLHNEVRRRKSIFLVQTKPGQHEELFSILANMRDFVSNYDLRLLRLQVEQRDDSDTSSYHTRDDIVVGQGPSFAESNNSLSYYENTRNKDKANWNGNVSNNNDSGPGRRTEHQNGRAHARFRTTSSNITPHKVPPQKQHESDYPMLHESVCENCKNSHGNGRYEDDFLESAKLRRSWPSTGHGRQRHVEVMHICEICMSRYYREKAQISSKWPPRQRTPLTMESKDHMNEQRLDQFEEYCPSCAMVGPIDKEFGDCRGQAYTVRQLHEPRGPERLHNGSVKCSCLESDSPYICSDCFVKKIVGRTDADDAKAKSQNMDKGNEKVIGKLGMARGGRTGSAPAKFRSYPNNSEIARVTADFTLQEKRKDKELESFVEQIIIEDNSAGVKERSSVENDGGKEARTESSEEGRLNSGSSLEERGSYETRNAKSSKESFNYNNEENQEFLFREKSNSEDKTKIGFEMGREEDEGQTGISDNAKEEHVGGSNVNEDNDAESRGSFNTTLDDLLAKLGSGGSTPNEASDNEAKTGNEHQRETNQHQQVSIGTSPIQDHTQSPDINADMKRVSSKYQDWNKDADFTNLFPLTEKQKFMADLEAPFRSSASPNGKNENKTRSSQELGVVYKDGFENDPLNVDSKENTNGSLDLYDYDIFNNLDDDDAKFTQILNLRSQSRKKPPKRNEFQTTNGKYFCQFCPDKEFSSKSVWSIHMKNCHKKCNCPCGEYFETREDYLLHFYQLFPLACFLERKCPERFRSLYFQAVHHRDRHHSGRPFYCVLCFADVENSESRKRACFKDIKSLRIHAEGMGHNPNEMYLISSATEMDSSMLPWSMKCTGIDFC